MVELIHRTQVEHVFNEALWNNPAVKAVLDRLKGYSSEALGNKLLLFADADLVARIQALPEDHPYRQALLNKNSGVGIVRHDGGAPGGNQFGKLRFLEREVLRIEASVRADGTPVSDAAKRVALDNLYDWTWRLMKGEILGNNGKPIGGMGNTPFREVLTDAFLNGTSRSPAGYVEPAQFENLANASAQATKQRVQQSYQELFQIDASTGKPIEKSNQWAASQRATQLAEVLRDRNLSPPEIRNRVLKSLGVDWETNFAAVDAAVTEAATIAEAKSKAGAWPSEDAALVQRYLAEARASMSAGELRPGASEDSLLKRFLADESGRVALEFKYADQLKAALGDYGFETARAMHRSAISIATKASEIAQGVGSNRLTGFKGSMVGLGIGYIDSVYDFLKKGFQGDWSDFLIENAKFGAVAGSAFAGIAVITGAVAGTAIAPFVAAGFALAGVYATGVALGDLMLKVAVDLGLVELPKQDGGVKNRLQENANFLNNVGEKVLLAAVRGQIGKAPILPTLQLKYEADTNSDKLPDQVRGTNISELFYGKNGAIINAGSGADEIYHSGYGRAFGEDGQDVLVGNNGTVLAVGDPLYPWMDTYRAARQEENAEIDAENAIRAERGIPLLDRLPDLPPSPKAQAEQTLKLDGGQGNDIVFAFGGSKVTTIGGLGRDWIYNRSNGGVIWGDSENFAYLKPVLDAQGNPVLNPDGTPKTTPVRVDDVSANSDNIWYSPNTVVKDAQHKDLLKFYGFTLTGGNAEGGIAGLGAFGGIGGVVGMANFYFSLDESGKYNPARSIYFDHLFPWMTYAFKPNANGGLDMFVTNTFDQLFTAVFSSTPSDAYKAQQALDAQGIWKGFMKIENFDLVGSFIGLRQFELKGQGTFGMVFKAVNPLADIMAIIGPLTGLAGMALSAKYGGMALVDQALTLSAAAIRLEKSLHWAEGLDPLVIDLDGDGLETTEIATSQAYFDIDGDLFAERMGWLTGDDGFLVRDLNGNARIDNISEMFGGVGQSGFAHLAELDSNGDGKITSADLLWGELKVWQDYNRNGVTDDGELKTLDELGIVSIDLGATPIDIRTSGAQLTAFGEVTFASGAVRHMYDATLASNNTDTKYAGESGRADWQSGSTLDLKGFGSVTNLSVAMANDIALGELVTSTAAAMTTPKMRTLVAQVGDVLGTWGAALELTRELTPVLVGMDGGGNAVMLDRGVYVEDAQGGYWTLASGAPVLDAQGQPIARATMQDVLAQAAASGANWRLEQTWSPSSRVDALTERDAAPYLMGVLNGRAVIIDYGIKQADGTWKLASDPITSYAGKADILALAHPTGTEWRTEAFGFNPYAELPVDKIGVRFTDGIAVDYTVKVTDQDGTFYVWARNLDRALQLEWKTGDSRDFNLRNYAIDFDSLDEVNSTDDSTYRVEMLTPAQFHFATSLGGIDFRPEMLTAHLDNATGHIAYAVGPDGSANLSTDPAQYVSGIATMIDLLQPVMEQYVATSRRYAVRLAMQGGLKDFFEGVRYDVASDSYKPTTNRELAPVFEEIFRAAPPSNANDAVYDYLAEWNAILNQVYPDYRPTGEGNLGGSQLAVDQAFIMQMLLPAFEAVGVDLDIRAVANALSIDEERIITHAAGATTVDGTNGTDYFYMTGGNQTLRGGRGADFYFVGRNSGADIIDDKDFGDSDELRFTDVLSTDVKAIRDNQDLVLQIAGRPDVIRLKDQFLGELNDLLSNGKRADSGVNGIVFADGVVWDRFRMSVEVVDKARADGLFNDVFVGSGSGDVLWGGKGNDVMHGGAGGDIYVFAPGDGQDVIGENGNFSFGPLKAGIDILRFQGGITLDNIKLVRDGASQDLHIYLLDDEGNLTGDSILVEGQLGGARLNLEAFGVIDPGLGVTYVSPSQIERFVFDDGYSLDFEGIVALVLESARTTGDDAIYGLLNDNTLDGGAGDDYLSGIEGGDTYVFGRGYGQDVIEDNDYSNKLFGNAPDRLRFIDDLRWTDFDYLRVGPSDTVTMRITGTDDQITMIEDLKSAIVVGYINLIEEIEFGDGTVWSYTKLLQHYIDVAKTAGNDTIYGFDLNDFLDGGAGNDRLEGLGGNDTYYFAPGYGIDTILDTDGEERLTLAGIASGDVTFSRTALDLIITVNGTGDRIVIENQYVRDDKQHFAVEYFEFSDRTIAYTDFNPEDLDLVGTNAGESITGSDFGETLDGRGGDDTLTGGDGGDRYKFDIGYGHDVIVDRRARAAWQDRQFTVVPVDDVVVFGDDILFENLLFTQDGNDLVISVQGHTDTLRIRNQFRSAEDEIERFEFQDGTFKTIENIEAILQIAGGNRGDNEPPHSADHPNTLDGRQGNDTLNGGTAGDTYVFSAGWDHDRIIEQPDAPGVIDRVVFGASVRQETLIVRRNGDDLQIDLGTGADVLTIVGGLLDTRVEEFHFADGSVLTIDDFLARMLIGGTGDDQLTGFDNRDDLIVGGAGSDAMAGGTGNDTYRFGYQDGSDSVRDTGGIDRIEFGVGVTRDKVTFEDIDGDLLIRLTGTNDRLVVLGGIAAQESGTRIESFVFDGGETLSYADVLSFIRAHQSNAGQDLVERTEAPDQNIEPGTGFDTVRMVSGSRLVFRSGDGIDRVETVTDGGFGAQAPSEIEFADLLSTSAVVRLAGLDGNDLLITFPATGDQVLVAGRPFMPTITFADGQTWTSADLIARSIAAQAGAENDVIFGSSLNDTIAAGRGDDDVRGGAGNDTFIYVRGDGRDVIQDTSGTDVLKISGYTPAEMRVSRPVTDRNELVLTFEGAEDEIVLRYDASFNGVDSVVFGDGTTFTRDQLFARTIGQGTDYEDELAGSAGDDTLEGGKGDDLLMGDAGVDTYIFRRGDGHDIISEAGSRFDLNKLVLPDHLPSGVTAIRVEDSPNDVVLRLGGGDEIVLENALNTSFFSSGRIKLIEFANGVIWTTAELQSAVDHGLTPTGPLVIQGTSGSDTLTGTSADELYIGGDNNDNGVNDRFIYAVGGGRDTIRVAGQVDSVNTLELRGYTRDDAIYSIAPENRENLIIRFAGTDDEIVVERALAFFGWSSTYDFDTDTYTFTYFRAIQNLQFDDGIARYEDVRAALIASQVSDGNDTIAGTPDGDIIEPGLGNDHITSLAWFNDYDTIIFNEGDGQDVIDTEFREYGRLRIRDYTPQDLTFTRLANDEGFRINFAGSDDSIEVRGFYAFSTFGGIREIVFDGGFTWDYYQYQALIPFEPESGAAAAASPTAGDDILTGGPGDTIEALTGDDVVVLRDYSMDDPTTIVYSLGDGQDTVDAEYRRSAYRLELNDIDPADVRLLVSPGYSSLTGGDFPEQTTDFYLEIVGTNDGIWLKGAGDLLREITFADGTVWDEEAIANALEDFSEPLAPEGGAPTALTFTSTPDDEFFVQFESLPIGGDNNYIYSRGGGNDIIDETESEFDNALDTILFTDISSTEMEVRVVESIRNAPWEDLMPGDLLITFGSLSDSLRIVGGQYSSDGWDQPASGIEAVTFSDGVTMSLQQLTALAWDNEDNDPRSFFQSFDFTRGLMSGRYNVEISTDWDDPIIDLHDVLASEISFTRIYDPKTDNDVLTLVIAAREPDGSDAALIQIGSRWDLWGLEIGLDDGAIPFELVYAMMETGESGPADEEQRSFESSFSLTRGDESGLYVIFRQFDEDDEGEPISLDLNDVLPEEITIEQASSFYGYVVRIAARLPDGSDAATILIDGATYENSITITLDDGTVFDDEYLDELPDPAPTHILIGTGPDGPGQQLVFLSTVANDTILLPPAPSIIEYERGDGFDTILNAGAFDFPSGGEGGTPTQGEFDEFLPTLVLHGIAPADVRIVAHGPDLLIYIAESAPGAGDGSRLRYADGNRGSNWNEPYRSNLGTITFDDGTIWSSHDISDRVGFAFGTSGDDVITEAFGGTRFELGAGNDRVFTESTNATFVYRNGDGNDVYEDSGRDPFILQPDGNEEPGGDTLELPDFLPSDVRFTREVDDLVITIVADPGRGIEAGRIAVKGAFAGDEFDNRLIETVRFGNGSTMSGLAILDAAINATATAGDDRLEGTDHANTFDGGAGRDTLIGNRGADTYVWSRGDGNDEIFEDADFREDTDTLRLIGVAREDVSFAVGPRGLFVRVAQSAPGAADGGEILVLGQLVEGHPRAPASSGFCSTTGARSWPPTSRTRCSPRRRRRSTTASSAATPMRRLPAAAATTS